MKRTLFVLFVLSLFVSACGIPEDSEPTSLAAAQPTAVPATPTAQPQATQLFPIYLVDDADGRLRRALRELPKPLTITALVNELIEETTDEEQELSLITIIPAETEFAAPPSSLDMLAELDFVSETSIGTLEGPQLTLALAQLVWTLTESPSIHEVIIRIDGEDQVWPTSQEDTLPGLPLTRDDYAEFGPDFVEPTPEPESEDPPSEEADPPSEGQDPTPNPEASPEPEDG